MLKAPVRRYTNRVRIRLHRIAIIVSPRPCGADTLVRRFLSDRVVTTLFPAASLRGLERVTGEHGFNRGNLCAGHGFSRAVQAIKKESGFSP
jgi:hypothetical protein